MNPLNDNITDRRKQTRSAVFRYLYESPEPRSKQDISRDLSISMPTVYQNVSELLEAGYIEYCGLGESSGGRPPMYLRPVSDVCCAIGMNVTVDTLHFAATDLSCQETAFYSVKCDLPVDSPDFADFACAELERFIDANGIDRNRLLGVGITLAGLVDSSTNTVLFAPPLSLRNTSLRLLVRSIPYPVFLENDANSGGFAEWYNSDRKSSMAFLYLGEGVGGAMFVNGDQFNGTNNRSGEFGHMCVEPNGRLCSCGKRGCLEAYCSSSRFQRELGLSDKEFFDRLKDGDAEAYALWRDYSRHLVLGIHNIRMLLDCDIVLGGYQGKYLGDRLPELREMLADTDPFDTSTNYLRVSEDPEYRSILGVALYFIRDFVDNI